MRMISFSLTLVGLLGVSLGVANAALAPYLTSSLGSESAPGSFFRFLTPTVSPAELAVLRRLPGFTIPGRPGATEVYILFRPACPHCHALYQQWQLLAHLHPQLREFMVTWIPVVLTPTDGQILAEVWPGSANLRGPIQLADLMAATPKKIPLQEWVALQQITRPSMDWLRRTGAQSVPAIVVVPPKGDPRMYQGDPLDPELLRWLGVSQ